MDNRIKAIEDFLIKKPQNTILVFNEENHQEIQKNITHQIILQQYRNVEDFLKSLKVSNPDLKKIGVQKVRPNGTSTKKEGYPIIIALKEKSLPEGADKETEIATPNKSVVASPVSPVAKEPTIVAPVPNYHPNPLGLMGSLGLNGLQILDLNTKASKYDDLKGINRDLKDDKRKLEGKIESLTDELRQTKAFLAIAEKEKEVAVKLKEIEKRPAIDPSTLNAAIETFKEALPLMVGQKNQAGLAGAEVDHENLSEAKSYLVEIIKKDGFPDQLATKLAEVIAGTKLKPESFLPELDELLIKHEIISQ